MKGFVSTVGKIAVGLSFGVGVGLATWVAGVCYGAAGALQATREGDESREKLEEAVENHYETIKGLGEMALDK